MNNGRQGLMKYAEALWKSAYELSELCREPETLDIKIKRSTPSEILWCAVEVEAAYAAFSAMRARISVINLGGEDDKGGEATATDG